MLEILKEEVISICCEGHDIGRYGKLAWICIATQSYIYLLDVAKLTLNVCLQNGLRTVLTDRNVVKVVNDSRQFQDYLWHHSKLSISNVFDVQVSHPVQC